MELKYHYETTLSSLNAAENGMLKVKISSVNQMMFTLEEPSSPWGNGSHKGQASLTAPLMSWSQQSHTRGTAK